MGESRVVVPAKALKCKTCGQQATRWLDNGKGSRFYCDIHGETELFLSPIGSSFVNLDFVDEGDIIGEAFFNDYDY